MRGLMVLPLVGLLGGCAGYAADYVKSKSGIVEPQLARFGLDAAQTRCVGGKLDEGLTTWQARQLADTAARARGSGALTVRELLYVSRLVPDDKVATELARAVEGCGVVARAAASAPAPTAPIENSPAPAAPTETAATPAPATPGAAPPTPGATAPKGSVWVNLGTAQTGQSISIDASSVQEEPPYRKAWFRLTNPGETGPGALAYLLRMDCAGKTITPMGGRKYDPQGGVAEQKDYGAEWEGALPVESGTVMEIAFRSLCGG